MQVLLPDYLVDPLLPRMRALDPTVEVLALSADGSHPAPLDNVEVLFRHFPNDIFPPGSFGSAVLRTVLREVPRLRWLHTGSTGVENLLIPELLDSDIVITNDSGSHKLDIAESVLGYLLADAKALPGHLRNQQLHRWQHLPQRELQGLTVAVLGLGNIGLEVARLCHVLGMRVLGTKRTVTGEPLPGVDEVFPADRQNECVAQADYVVITAALTPLTRGMVNAATFSAMRPDAVLVNVARGANVDEGALLDALQSGRIRGAYLDVFSVEPLPADSPFWGLPNVVVTPHCSPYSPNMGEQSLAIFVDNFRRFRAGEPLRNVVDKRAGY